MRYTSLVLAGALAGTVLTAPAATAAAAAAADYSAQKTDWYRCVHKGSVCLFQHEEGRGQWPYRPPTGPGDANFHDNSCSGCRSSTNRRANGTWGDQISSVWNRTNHRYCFYFDIHFNKARRNGVPDVKVQGGEWTTLTHRNQDQISSGRPC